MPPSSPNTINYNFTPDTPRLLPEGRFTVSLALNYSPDGVLDFQDLLGQLTARIEDKMGKIKPLGQASRHGLKVQIAQAVIDCVIHPITNVLDSFSDDGKPYWNAEGRLCLPLRMKGSGRKIVLAPKLNSVGELDLDALVASCEEAYLGVMSEVLKGYPGPGILSPGQKEAIRRNGPHWLCKKTYRINKRLLLAVDFELITDDEAWLRGGGIITVRMVIKESQFAYAGTPRQIKVYSSNNAFFDLEGISNQLATMLSEYLQSRNHIALIQFSGGLKAKMIQGWQEKAANFLIDDIRADEDIFAELPCRSEDGRKIIIENALGRKISELPIDFENGLCYFDVMIDMLNKDFASIFNKNLLFDNPQMASAKRKIVPLIITAIRDIKYSHPYPQHAIDRVLDIKKGIIHYADQHGISHLALAGAIADEFENDITPVVEQFFNDKEKILVAAVIRNLNRIDGYISKNLFFLSAFTKPKWNAFWQIADTLWSILPSSAKDMLLISSAKAIYRSITDPPKLIIEHFTKQYDTVSDFAALIKFHMGRSWQVINEVGLKNCEFQMKSIILREGLEGLVKLSIIMSIVGGESYLINKATIIEHHLRQAEQAPDRREYICKWERLCNNFKS